MPGKLGAIEKTHGKLSELIPALLEKNDGNQRRVGDILGVSQSHISYWLRTNGYKRYVKWIKSTTETKGEQL